MDATNASFDQDVIERSRTVPVLVDFWADWCGPCRALTPALEDAVAARSGALELVKVDIDANPSLSRRFQIQGIPAVKLFRDGALVDEFVGMRPRAAIDTFLDAALPPPAPTAYEHLLERLRESRTRPSVLEALELGYFDQALAQLQHELEAAAGDPAQDELRTMMLAIFEQLGATHPLSTRYRSLLATAIM